MSKKATVEEFVTEASIVHNNKYSYPKANYINRQTNICITCSEHGDFWQTPQNHLKGDGCKKCGVQKRAKKRRSTNEIFVNRANVIHNNEYSYPKANYINTRTKICITCSEHGDFWQTPQNHLNGTGCPKCRIDNRKNKNFVDEANETHGHKYNYPNINYVNSNTKVCIVCPKHGDFWQTPKVHLKAGCPKCYNEKRGKSQIKKPEEFLSEINKIHDQKYNYPNLNYVNSKTSIRITCPEHGDFWQTPNKHLGGNGCPKCAIKRIREALAKKPEEFLSEANKMHGQKYNYPNLNYVNFATKICITCSKHGDFWQTPHSHLKGSGCPKCHSSLNEWEIEKHLKKYNIKYHHQFKLKKCKNKRALPFDFLVKTKTIFLIEFNGGHHYFKVRRSRSLRENSIRFVNFIYNDNIKLKYCKQRKIPLLIIPYWDSQRIPEILNDVLAGKTPTFSKPPEIVEKYEPTRKKIRDRLGIKEPEVLFGWIKNG